VRLTIYYSVFEKDVAFLFIFYFSIFYGIYFRRKGQA
jgi:hypothetical protein